MGATREGERGAVSPPPAWTRWLFGLAVLGLAIIVALHWTDGRDFVLLAEEAEPAWLLAAAVLQALTYAFQSAVWQVVLRRARPPQRVGAWPLYRLSVAKLFVDQAVPSAGVSGTVLIVRGLEKRGVPRGPVMACVVVETVTNFTALGLALALALVIAQWSGMNTRAIWIASLGFLAFCLAASVLLLTKIRGRAVELPGLLARWAPLRTVAEALGETPPGLARSPISLGLATGCNFAIHLLDAATLWVLLRSVGVSAAPDGVFAAFMFATLGRTIGIVPGGLGTFDGVAIATLHLAGVPTAAAIAATLLFRGFSFWIPLWPGLWASRVELRANHARATEADHHTYLRAPTDEVLRRLGTGPAGLSDAEAAARLEHYGPNALELRVRDSLLRLLWSQVKSPLVLLLLFAAVVSLFSGEWTDAGMVILIVAASVTLGFTRERSAQGAIARLRSLTQLSAQVIRAGKPRAVPVNEVVPGDLVLLSAGAIVPADARLLETNDLFVEEAALTGESFAVEKREGEVPADAELVDRTNTVFRGTHVQSGTGRALVTSTGKTTELGRIAARLGQAVPETEFDRGLRHYGYVLLATMFVIVVGVFTVQVLLDRPPIQTLLFALALAVGLSPELLPAILSVNLAAGAQAMASRGVLVRRLNAIENLGSMDVLCTDKTGTLTEGTVRLVGALGLDGAPSDRVLDLAVKNAALHAGMANPLDEAILRAAPSRPDPEEKRAEIPYDFVRKRLSVVVGGARGPELISKGAVAQLLEVCTGAEGAAAFDRDALLAQVDRWGRDGQRVLGVAVRSLDERPRYGTDDETGLTLVGFLLFSDAPKQGVGEAIAELRALGVEIKLITGDSHAVAAHVAAQVGLGTGKILTGHDLDEMRDEALWSSAEGTDLFVEVDPNQKERIILALKKRGRVVGFLGDGINDAPAMHAADTALSVETATDVARDAADFVLLRRDLAVLRQGVLEGRRTFANTLKYIQTTTSANLGNMVSMAAASLFLPFLPLLPSQVLLNNFLSDIPAVGLASDRVDPELIASPRRWDMRAIGSFMIGFGLVSSVFDFATFGALLAIFHATADEFRTGWFIESLLTELVIALVVRTRRRFYRSRPGKVLLFSTVALAAATIAIPYLPYASVFGFIPLPPLLLGTIVGITALYVVATEAVKKPLLGDFGEPLTSRGRIGPGGRRRSGTRLLRARRGPLPSRTPSSRSTPAPRSPS